MKYSKAARRRNKRAMPQLAETPRREKSGCFVERTRQIQEDPKATIRKALSQQHDVLGDPENADPYGAQNHPVTK